MKQIILINVLLILFLSFASGQEYTWDGYSTTYTGGIQTTNSYTSFTSHSWFQSSFIIAAEEESYTGFLQPKLDIRVPEIDTIYDVENDQGRYVHVNWSKCGYDNVYDPDRFYSIWRQDDLPYASAPENISNDIESVLAKAIKKKEGNWYWAESGNIWTFIEEIPALNFDTYSVVAPTVQDSLGPETINHSSFKIIFHDEYAYYESAVDSGFSIDNLSPDAPVLNGSLALSSIDLDLDENNAEDFQYFEIYKSEDPLSFPEYPYALISDTVFTDVDLSADELSYYANAVDFNGNKSPASNIITLGTRLRVSLKVFMEGPWGSSSMTTSLNTIGFIPTTHPYNFPPWFYSGEESVEFIPNESIVDWLLVEFRDATTATIAVPSTMIEQQAAFLLSDGSIVGMDGESPISTQNQINNNLYIVIHHRNHLSIMSSNEPIIVDGILSYDFTQGEAQVIGGDLGYVQNSGGSWYMASGDCNADGSINTGDKILNWSTEVGLPGYMSSDLNMNGQVDHVDKNVFWLNNFGMESQVPK